MLKHKQIKKKAFDFSPQKPSIPFKNLCLEKKNSRQYFSFKACDSQISKRYEKMKNWDGIKAKPSEIGTGALEIRKVRPIDLTG